MAVLLASIRAEVRLLAVFPAKANPDGRGIWKSGAPSPKRGGQIEGRADNAVQGADYTPGLGRIHVALEQGEARIAEAEQRDRAPQGRGHDEQGLSCRLARCIAQPANSERTRDDAQEGADHFRKVGKKRRPRPPAGGLD